MDTEPPPRRLTSGRLLCLTCLGREPANLPSPGFVQSTPSFPGRARALPRCDQRGWRLSSCRGAGLRRGHGVLGRPGALAGAGLSGGDLGCWGSQNSPRGWAQQRGCGVLVCPGPSPGLGSAEGTWGAGDPRPLPGAGLSREDSGCWCAQDLPRDWARLRGLRVLVLPGPSQGLGSAEGTWGAGDPRPLPGAGLWRGLGVPGAQDVSQGLGSVEGTRGAGAPRMSLRGWA